MVANCSDINVRYEREFVITEFDYTFAGGDVLSDSRVTTFVNDLNKKDDEEESVTKYGIDPSGDAVDGDVSTFENPFTSYNKGNNSLERWSRF